MFMPHNLQESFETLGHEALKILDGFSDIDLNKDVEDQDIRQNLNAIKHEISRGIKTIQKTLKDLLHNAEWDTINIGFFGETNAGKSTLIETLTKGDGSTIGDGRKDFTKQLSRVPYKGTHFFDMPGIEGNEEKVKDEICRAMGKCHVIFYVVRGGKTPEEPTLRKVGGYLRDYAKVYSIMNIDGRSSKYKYVDQLITEDLIQVEKDSIKAFRRILSGHYHSNSKLQGHLAFLARGKPVREDLLKEQKKALAIFTNSESILEFSGFKSLETVLSNLEIKVLRK